MFPDLANAAVCCTVCFESDPVCKGNANVIIRLYVPRQVSQSLHVSDIPLV
jgi:hypothetical protein